MFLSLPYPPWILQSSAMNFIVFQSTLFTYTDVVLHHIFHCRPPTLIIPISISSLPLSNLFSHNSVFQNETIKCCFFFVTFLCENWKCSHCKFLGFFLLLLGFFCIKAIFFFLFPKKAMRSRNKKRWGSCRTTYFFLPPLISLIRFFYLRTCFWKKEGSASSVSGQAQHPHSFKRLLEHPIVVECLLASQSFSGVWGCAASAAGSQTGGVLFQERLGELSVLQSAL